MASRISWLRGGINVSSVADKHLTEKYTNSVGKVEKLVYTTGRRGRPVKGFEKQEFIMPQEENRLKLFLNSEKKQSYKAVYVHCANVCAPLIGVENLYGCHYMLSVDHGDGLEAVVQLDLDVS